MQIYNLGCDSRIWTFNNFSVQVDLKLQCEKPWSVSWLLASAWIPPAMESSPLHKAAHSIFSKFSLVLLSLLYFQSLSSKATQNKSNISPIMIAHYIFNIIFGSPSGTICSSRLNITSYFNSFKTSVIFSHITHLYVCSVCLKMQYQSWKPFQFILTIAKCNEGQYLP